MTQRGPGNDREIKRLLRSNVEARRRDGLLLLDAAYRIDIGDKIRDWSEWRGIWISPLEIGEIWGDTLDSVWKNVKKGSFRKEGGLRRYLATIAYRRGVDRVRKRMRKKKRQLFTLPAEVLDILNQTEQSSGDLQDSQSRLERAIRECFKKLPAMERETLLIDVRLFCLDDRFHWVTLAELTAEVNEESSEPVSLGAMKSRRRRARIDLRNCLKKRGYGHDERRNPDARS